MKKSILFTLMLAGMLLSITTISAQTTYDKSKNNYYVLTRSVDQLKPIILAAKDLAKEDGKKYGEFQVIICGKTVSDLVDKEKMKDYLQMAENNHVKLIACGFSVKKAGISKAELPSQVEVVNNGITYGLELQKDGFFFITL